MRAHVNGEECSVDMEGIATIGDLLQQLEVHMPPRDVIVGLRINGGECDSGPTSQIRNLPVSGVEDVELRTQSPEAFAHDARARLQDYLQMIRTKFERAVDCFDRQADDAALEFYRLGIDELRLIVTLWDQLNRLDEIASGATERLTYDLQRICDRLFAAHDRNDLSALRTVLADILLPFLQGWQTHVQG